MVDDFTLSLIQLKETEKTLLNRLLYKVNQSDLFRMFDDSEFRLFLYGLTKHEANLEELKLRGNRFLDDDRTACLTLIRLIAPTIISTRLNRREPSRDYIKSELTSDDINLLSAIVDIHKLYQQTIATYGHQSYTRSDTGSPYAELTDTDLIGQFQQLYGQPSDPM